MILIGLCGPAGAGKDTVGAMLERDHGFKRVAFADPIYRALAAMLDLPETVLRDRLQKDRALPIVDTSPRQLLQTLGTEWGRTLIRHDLWILLALRYVEGCRRTGARGVVLTDVRFENEADFIRNQGGQIWHVGRLGVQRVREHSSETGIFPLDADRGIWNDGPIEALRDRVDKLIGDLAGDRLCRMRAG